MTKTKFKTQLIAKCCEPLKAMLHEAIFLATCNATMTNKKLFKLQRGCCTQATCLATVRKVEGRLLLFWQLATQQLQLQNGVLHVNFFLQLATQRLLRCKLQEKLLRVTWPSGNVAISWSVSFDPRLCRLFNCFGLVVAKWLFKLNFLERDL